jgi:hypothetical protein
MLSQRGHLSWGGKQLNMGLVRPASRTITTTSSAARRVCNGLYSVLPKETPARLNTFCDMVHTSPALGVAGVSFPVLYRLISSTALYVHSSWTPTHPILNSSV